MHLERCDAELPHNVQLVRLGHPSLKTTPGWSRTSSTSVLPAADQSASPAFGSTLRLRP